MWAGGLAWVGSAYSGRNVTSGNGMGVVWLKRGKSEGISINQLLRVSCGCDVASRKECCLGWGSSGKVGCLVGGKGHFSQSSNPPPTLIHAERRAKDRWACDQRGAAGVQAGERVPEEMVGREGNVHSGEVETQGGVRELPHNLGSANICSRKRRLVPWVSPGG